MSKWLNCLGSVPYLFEMPSLDLNFKRLLRKTVGNTLLIETYFVKPKFRNNL